MAEVTQLLRDHARGDAGALHALLPLIHEDLRRAARLQRRRRAEPSLDRFFFRDGAIVRVPVTAAETFSVGAPSRVVSVDLIGDRLGPVYELSRDGSRFLIVETFDPMPVAGQLALVTHWDRDLAARLSPR